MKSPGLRSSLALRQDAADAIAQRVARWLRSDAQGERNRRAAAAELLHDLRALGQAYAAARTRVEAFSSPGLVVAQRSGAKALLERMDEARTDRERRRASKAARSWLTSPDERIRLHPKRGRVLLTETFDMLWGHDELGRGFAPGIGEALRWPRAEPPVYEPMVGPELPPGADSKCSCHGLLECPTAPPCECGRKRAFGCPFCGQDWTGAAFCAPPRDGGR